MEKQAKRKQKQALNPKVDLRLEKLKPYLNSELSYQKIADTTGIPKSTVRSLMKKLV